MKDWIHKIVTGHCPGCGKKVRFWQQQVTTYIDDVPIHFHKQHYELRIQQTKRLTHQLALVQRSVDQFLERAKGLKLDQLAKRTRDAS